jgi:hypothetical protein
MHFPFTAEIPMNWDWIAGFFEGEGCIYWREGTKGTKSGTSGGVIIGQRVKDPLTAIYAFLIEEGIHNPILYLRPQGKNPRSRPIWILRLNIREDVVFFLEHVRHALFDKQPKADFVIGELTRLNKEREEVISKAMALRTAGASWPAIKAETGCGRVAITNHMRAAGLDWHKLPGWDSQYSWRLERMTRGLCGCCGSVRGESVSQLYCDTCQEKRRVLVREWKAKRRAAGLPV